MCASALTEVKKQNAQNNSSNMKAGPDSHATLFVIG